MKKTVVAAVVAAMVLPDVAVAAPALEESKKSAKVRPIGELDENAPHDISGKVQFIPTKQAGHGGHALNEKQIEKLQKKQHAADAKAEKKKLRAEIRAKRLEAKAEKRAKKREEKQRLHGLRAAKKAERAEKRHAKKTRVQKVRVKKVHVKKVHAKKAHGKKARAAKRHKHK